MWQWDSRAITVTGMKLSPYKTENMRLLIKFIYKYFFWSLPFYTPIKGSMCPPPHVSNYDVCTHAASSPIYVIVKRTMFVSHIQRRWLVLILGFCKTSLWEKVLSLVLGMAGKTLPCHSWQPHIRVPHLVVVIGKAGMSGFEHSVSRVGGDLWAASGTVGEMAHKLVDLTVERLAGRLVYVAKYIWGKMRFHIAEKIGSIHKAHLENTLYLRAVNACCNFFSFLLAHVRVLTL